ncbi:uncharacterized protein LOC111869959 [Cryptotermes secundus]|uniref:uncharacterized protein LOC111869959 n=1 Tax=Cryptotermes secundus TaxID=105785 RepID=UPI000CD7D5DE|nr:uncharacterized protein LOC111869959 [Cryptotermes secundus]XP_023717631.1 uncharacterized protein LOC111869959 [Cryptotermes secundus]
MHKHPVILHSFSRRTSGITMTQVVSFCLLVGTFCIALSAAVPYRHRLQLIPLVGDQQVEESAFVPRTVLPASDLQAAATGHGHYGRVQIKVYRGPSAHGHHDHFAPHGFWVKQPADDYHH